MNIEEYKETFDNPLLWFVEEVELSHHLQRISGVIANKLYLSGQHAVLENRKDAPMYKGKTFETRKIVLNYMKTILQFHSTYLCGNSITLTGEDKIVEAFNQIYKDGLYTNVDYRIVDKVNKFGDSYEIIFIDDDSNKTIKSKVMDSSKCYPVYTDEGEYISFIEHWVDAYSKVSYFNIFYPSYTEIWNNKGGEMCLIDTKTNVAGLPVHYHNFSDIYETFGSSSIDDVKNLIDELEDMLSKMGDSIFLQSLSPVNVAIGQPISGNIDVDYSSAMVLNLDIGDYKVVSTMIDHSTIKLYLDNIKTMLNDIANVPGVITANTNVSNVSEVSLKLLFHMANIKAMESEQWMREGMIERFKKIKAILKLKGMDYGNDIPNISFNLSRPASMTEILTNLQAQYNMGAISKQTIIEQSPLTVDAKDEMDKIKEEQGVIGVK